MPPPVIPDDELHVTYILASGPGGQNVNKVATAAQLRFDVRNSPSLPPRTKHRLTEVAGSRMTGDGVIVLTARRFRSQTRNREDAVARLHEMIGEASTVQAYRVPTAPHAASAASGWTTSSTAAASSRGAAAALRTEARMPEKNNRRFWVPPFFTKATFLEAFWIIPNRP